MNPPKKTKIKEKKMAKEEDLGAYQTFSVSLVSQGKHRFYTLSMPSDVLAKTCTVDTRADNPLVPLPRDSDRFRLVSAG